MAGPYPPHQGTGTFGPQPGDPYSNQPFGAPPAYGSPYGPPRPANPPFGAGPPHSAYPGALPPPVPYPKRSRWKPIAAVLVAVAVIAAVALVAVFAGSDADSGRGGAALTPAAAQDAIQGYLDAMSEGDLQAISRNALCGLYDGVRDRRADDALARLSSDAFQKQFSSAQVTSVDTMVFASPSSAQVLFSMNVVPTTGNRGGSGERQGVAQLLAHDGEILVCSYVLRTAGTF
jgi:hypothetical protein